MTVQRSDGGGAVNFSLDAVSATLLTQAEAAKLLRISARTLERYRVSGDGPTFCRLGRRRVVYAREDLLAWVRAGRRSSTSASTSEREA